MGKILPILLAVIGLGAGAGAGFVLKPEPTEMSMECACSDSDHTEEPKAKEPEKAAPDDPRDYIKLNNQFIVPIVSEARVNALVVMSISIEVLPEERDTVYQREPKLRDSFLQVLFDHANAGGFDGNFTVGTKMSSLRRALLETAQATLGDRVTGVLVTDIARQDN
ncbi:flagellar basal body-associated FliL family protein [Actibacterium sp. 188UL27-1]|uniref:flagellar basal body-associated FliL family protein n=1 Tax=Actibacterium sp. 188UL27-1 TaxID=2786961 RepID=UPI00195C8B2C|nr:flagellar basal body-associated FliL family protein [Actibacterium sp. 188UL27-1]MBM7066212.1 flagellar basal body-associated FliL family protein [Actibacterium sp. 188UL27-1]